MILGGAELVGIKGFPSVNLDITFKRHKQNL
jgi:hypothetical protein